jgi:hypothetical protein
MGEDKLCNNQQAVGFVFGFYDDAKELAAQVSVPVENILGLAAEESQYGTGTIAREYNNYFSLHAPAKFQTGEKPAKGDPKVKVATFESFKRSGQSFLDHYGEKIRGVSDPSKFALALVDARFNSGNSENGGRSDFVDYLVGIIKAVKVRSACKRPSYEK